MKYNTFIFDMDGTLLDTVEDLANAVNYALNVYGYEQKSVDTIATYLGDGIYKLIERAIPYGMDNSNYESVLEIFRKYYNENMINSTRAYDGITDLLKKLKENDCKIAIVSNKADKFVKMLSKYFFDGYIDISVGESDKLRKKPDSDMVEYVLNKLGANKKESVYIGDSEVDIQTANNSNLQCISVSWGFRDKEFLIKSGAIHIIDNPMDLLKFI